VCVRLQLEAAEAQPYHHSHHTAEVVVVRPVQAQGAESAIQVQVDLEEAAHSDRQVDCCMWV